MGKIKAVLIDIEEMLQEGYAPDEISALLNCPVEWVDHVIDEFNENGENSNES
jgi:hypothetical protein